MTVWNVRVAVVELVEAADGDAAIRRLRDALDIAGFTVYDDPAAGWGQDAFESEPLPDGTTVLQ